MVIIEVFRVVITAAFDVWRSTNPFITDNEEKVDIIIITQEKNSHQLVKQFFSFFFIEIKRSFAIYWNSYVFDHL